MALLLLCLILSLCPCSQTGLYGLGTFSAIFGLKWSQKQLLHTQILGPGKFKSLRYHTQTMFKSPKRAIEVLLNTVYNESAALPVYGESTTTLQIKC